MSRLIRIISHLLDEPDAIIECNLLELERLLQL